jgi:hypothetical protein
MCGPVDAMMTGGKGGGVVVNLTPGRFITIKELRYSCE